MTHVRQGIDLYQGLNTPPVFWPLLLYIQAQVYGQAGKPEQGLIELDEAMELLGPDSEDVQSPEFYRLKGNLLLAVSPDYAPEAEAWFQRAIKVAQKGQVLMMELRAAISLSPVMAGSRQSRSGQAAAERRI